MYCTVSWPFFLISFLKFLNSSLHPIDLGADLSCDSAHKTLGCLTGGAYLHISKNAPKDFVDLSKRAMMTFASTSPSYLIMQSLDNLNNILNEDFKNKLTKKDYFLYLLNRNIFLLLSPIIIVTLIVVFVFMVAKDGFSSGDVLYLLPILLFLLSYVQVNNAIKNAIKSNESTESLKIILDDKKYKEAYLPTRRYCAFRRVCDAGQLQ